MTERGRAAAIHGFLHRWLEDQEAGREHPLADYLVLFPAHASAIARKYAEILAPSECSNGRAHPGPDAAGPAKIGRFQILLELGRGGQGTVYLVHDPRLERRVALKVLAARFVADPWALERFRREAETVSRLDHPGLCTVHEVGEEGGLPFFVMRLVEGQSLAARIASAERPPRGEKEVFAVLALVAKAARALHVAHEAGVVHRDIKPGNIMVTPDEEPVILDFGLAYDEERSVSLTLSGDVFGTPAYMAPEQLDDSRRADRRTDVFALGVVLYECLTLRRPFEGPTRAALYRAILAEEAPDPLRRNPSLSRDVGAILSTALAKEPENRYPSAAALADDLDRVRRHEPVRARPAGPLLRLRRWVRRDRALAGTLAGLLVTLSAGFALTKSLEARAARSLVEEQRLADERASTYLLRTADELWPALPETVAPMDAWLVEVQAILERRSLPADELDRLAATHAQVSERRADAATLAARSIDEHRAAWDATIEEIASDPRYGGLRIVPQIGLVPLGRDPRSGLFEFAHLQTGEITPRDPVTQDLVVLDETSLVFVLVPGGTFCMGAEFPRANRYEEGPQHEVELGPFFLSKYEMTQGQWLRTTGANPSGFVAERDRKVPVPGQRQYDPDTSLCHPIENVSWRDCVAALERFGLLLPTEAQWEYAARAGTDGRYFTGDDPLDMFGAMNVADRSVERAGLVYYAGLEQDYDDGYPFLAPVDTFRPNPFGLHHVSGNVHEFVRDPYTSYLEPVRAGDGLRLGPDAGTRVLRGGAYVDRYGPLSLLARYSMGPEARFWSQGVRPGREVSCSSSSSRP